VEAATSSIGTGLQGVATTGEFIRKLQKLGENDWAAAPYKTGRVAVFGHDQWQLDIKEETRAFGEHLTLCDTEKPWKHLDKRRELDCAVGPY
jgi:hypothetical protein